MNKEILHYGIPGMKWGIRKDTRLKNVSDDRKKLLDILKKDITEMSNDDMRYAIDRMIKEKQIKEFTKKPPSFASRLFRSMGSAAVKAGASYGTSRLIDKYGTVDVNKLIAAGKSNSEIQKIQSIAKAKSDFLKMINQELLQQKRKD